MTCWPGPTEYTLMFANCRPKTKVKPVHDWEINPDRKPVFRAHWALKCLLSHVRGLLCKLVRISEKVTCFRSQVWIGYYPLSALGNVYESLCHHSQIDMYLRQWAEGEGLYEYPMDLNSNSDVEPLLQKGENLATTTDEPVDWIWLTQHFWGRAQKAR